MGGASMRMHNQIEGKRRKLVQVGKRAPSFRMEGFFKGKNSHYSLEDFEGDWKILFFYPLDFTFVCPTELVELSKKAELFKDLDAKILGVSVDSVYSHEAWLKELGEFNYPLLSDITKEVSRDYNVLIEKEGISLRGTFIIDPEGIVKHILVNDLSIGRNIDEMLRTLKALQTGDLCPVNWTPEKDTLGKA